MRTNLIPALAAPFFLAACSSFPIVGSGTNLVQAEANAQTFIAETDTKMEGMDITPFDNLPTNGTANYRGVTYGIYGGSGDGPDVVHYADLSASVNFQTTDVTGTIYNVTTDMPGFEKPTGTVAITGNIEDDGGETYFYADGSGSLTGTTMTADYEVLSLDGYLYGPNGEVIQGYSTVDINWTSGDHDGTTSWSDGEFYLIAPSQPLDP